jgi:hypothetical protein
MDRTFARAERGHKHRSRRADSLAAVRTTTTRGKLVRLAVALALALLGLEGLIRVALFSDSERIASLLWRLRLPSIYFDSRHEDEYWLLRHRLGDTGSVASDALHPSLGWVCSDLDRDTLRHRLDDGSEGERRLVLLYGDSFARCMRGAEPCFEDQLASSELGARWKLLNHGVPGYGVDQVLLLLEASLPRYVDREPAVAIGIYVEEDLDRALLDLRGSPKPRFELRDGSLELATSRVEPLDAYLRSHPLPATSYLARMIARSGLAPSTWREPDREEAVALCSSLLERLHADLETAGVEHFFLLFFGEPSALAPVADDWREPCIVDCLTRIGARYVTTRPAFREHASRNGGSISDCFLHEGPAAGHYNSLGNALAFQALADGLSGRSH